MASYTIATGAIALHDKTLVGGFVDTVTLVDVFRGLEIYSDGAAAIYFTMDTTTPTVSGTNTIKIPGGGPSSTVIDTPDIPGTVIKLISAGTPTYDLTKAQ